jgi:hypothetical protein
MPPPIIWDEATPGVSVRTTSAASKNLFMAILLGVQVSPRFSRSKNVLPLLLELRLSAS